MTTAFVSQLRTKGQPIFVASGPNAITIRVEASDLWETALVTALPSSSMNDVRDKVVGALFPAGERGDDFVLKLRGWEVLDGRGSLNDAGVVDGSILLLHYRRRRAVR